MYAPPAARLVETPEDKPGWILSAARHGAAVTNLLQCLGVAFLSLLAFGYGSYEELMVLLFALAPAVNVLTMWWLRGRPMANAVGACINLLWVVGVGGWMLFGIWSGWILALIVVGPQALGLGVQCVALSRHWRRWF